MASDSPFHLQPAVSDATSRLEGRDAQTANVAAGRALADTVRTTLGPRGLDKMLVGSDGRVVVTNDGASILDRMDVDHPGAQAIVDVAAQQDSRSGDGTTTAVVLTGELLARAEDLFERGLHPTSVIEGYHEGAARALEALEKSTLEVDADDAESLRTVARSVITGKWDDDATDFLAGLAVDAVSRVRTDRDVDFRKVTRKVVPGGSVYDAELIEGLVIDLAESSTDVVSPDTWLPSRFDDARVALVDDQLTIETARGQGTVEVDSPEQLAAFERYEDDVYDSYVDAIVASGADVVFCQKSIDEPVRYGLAREGILAVERTRQDELHKLGRATGARPVASVEELTPAATGGRVTVERRTVSGSELAVVRDFEGFDQVSLLLRGGPEHVAEETKRVVDDCFYVLRLVVRDGRVVPGGGATEIEMARAVRRHARSLAGRKQLAVEAFADALDVVPRTLAETAGLDPVDTLLALRSRHHDGDARVGLDVQSGEVTDMVECGVLDPTGVKERAVGSATEAANAILRVDDVIASSRDGHEHGGDEHDHDHGGTGLVESTEGYPWAVGHSMGHGHGHGH